MLYTFDSIRDPKFKEITFETNDDFTIIFDEYEIYAQVKKEKLTDTKIKRILENNKDTSHNVKQHIIASEIQGKLKNNLIYLSNAINSEFNLSKQYAIKEEFRELFQINSIPLDLIKNLVLDEIPESKLIQLVKYNIYVWTRDENLDIDIDGVFDSLITNISLNLRPNRGYINKQDIYDICLKYPSKKRSLKNNLHNNSYWAKDEIILLALQKYINEKERLATELTLLKVRIENKDYIEAEKLINNYSEYMPDFEFYKLWIMYKLNKFQLLQEYCDTLIKNDKSIYYSNYFKSLYLMEENNYSEAISVANIAQSIINSFEINLVLAKLNYFIGDKTNSRKYYKHCLEKQPDNCEVLVGISVLLSYDKGLEYIDRSITLNPDFYLAYLEKGKILRLRGKYEKASECFYKYLEFEKDSRELYRELSLCLINLKDEYKFEYLNKWLGDFLYEDLFYTMADNEVVLITDITIDQTNIITCTKSGKDFKISSQDFEFLLIKNDKSIITIGCMVDSFLKMTKDLFEESGSKAVNGYEYIPAIMKLYPDKSYFSKMINSFSFEQNCMLNKQYQFIEESTNEEWDFKEYICKDGVLEVTILEFHKDVKVDIRLGDGIITGDFNRAGKGYFNFLSKIESPSEFSEFALVLECGESREKVHIKSEVKSVKIIKKPLF